MVALRDASGAPYRDLLMILSWKNVVTVDFTAVHGSIAQLAFETFGRGRGHRAGLNYGDCMAYAVASVASAPLLFKGDVFSHTDNGAARRG